MKLLLLSEANSPHIIKWARSLAGRGATVMIFSLSKEAGDAYRRYPNITTRTVGFGREFLNAENRDLSKLMYLKALPMLKKAITDFRPDILHAHYATSYGVLGALSGFHPFVLSVWGSDVYNFPRKSFLHRALLKASLKCADRVLSTSRAMAEETRKYTDKDISVTPFGIDMEVFKPKAWPTPFEPGDIVIGTVKTLGRKYGIDRLMKAFKILKGRHAGLPLRLLMVGGGPEEANFRRLARELGIEGVTKFTGPVAYDEIHRYHNMLAVYAALSVSDSESFGVAVIEASACGKPVVVSDSGGLPEVVEDGVTGFVVKAGSPGKAAGALERLVLDSGLRERMGKAGRARVHEIYNLDINTGQMLSIYGDVLGQARLVT